MAVVYAYSRVAAFNPNTSPVSVARSATGSVYDINDTEFTTPLNLTLVATNTVTTTLTSDANGMFPDFTLPDRTQCVFKSGASVFVLTTTTPIPGPAGSTGKSVTNAAANAGNLVLTLNDGTTLNPVPLPTGSAIDDNSTAYLVGNGAQTKAALKAGYLPKWKPSTAYLAGDPVLSPLGDAVTSIADHTSGTSFTPANWNLSANLSGKLDKTEASTTYGKLSDFIVSAANYPGWTTGDRVGAIQAAHDALPGAQGGTIFIPGDVPASTVPLNITKDGVTLVGRGGSGQGVNLTWGATRFYAPANDWAIIAGVAGSSKYGGVTLRDFQIVGNSTSPGGVWMKSTSNFRTNGFTITGFTGSGAVGMKTDNAGGNSQYGTFYDLQITDCTVGWQNNGANGVRWFGGMIDANHNTGTIRAGSTAVKIIAGDTARFFGTVIQFAETCYDLAVGLNPELHGVRCEAFTTAIKNAAPSLRVYGGSFNNSIISGGGTVLSNLAGATNVFFDPGDISSVTTSITDAGSGTVVPTRKLASATYNPATAAIYSTTGTTSVDVDATNAAVTFTTPMTGRVVIDVQTVANLGSGSGYYLSVREGATDVVRRRMGLWGASGAQVSASSRFEVTGLTPGSSHTYKLGFAAISGTAQLQVGGDWGPLMMTVNG